MVFLVFVECATDNTTRTVANVKSYFNKSGGGIYLRIVGILCLIERQLLNLKTRYLRWGWIRTTNDRLWYGKVWRGWQYSLCIRRLYRLWHPYQGFWRNGYRNHQSKFTENTNHSIDFSDDQMADIMKLLDKLEDDDDVKQSIPIWRNHLGYVSFRFLE